jgi:lambda family phage portal protein
MTSTILKRWLQQQPGGYHAAASRAGLVPTLTPVTPLHGGQRRNYAAAQVNRLTQGWTTTSLSANGDVHASLDTLRARSRQLGRDNEYVKRYLGLVATNIIGSTGFNMQARVYDTNGKPDAGANGAIEQAFGKWSARGVCDVTGRSSLRDISRQAILAAARDGEFLIRIVRGTAAANPFQIALQLLDIDRLDTALNRPAEAGRNAIRMGIEHNAFGRPVRYWLRKSHPGETHTAGVDVAQSAHLAVPAEDIIHGYIADRPEQLRGVPWLHAAMLKLNDLGGYTEAAILASRVGASKMGFFTTPDGNVNALADEQADASDPDGDLYMDADPGSFGKLPPGYGFTPFNPDYPAAMFADFVKANLRGISSGLGVAYHALANDLEGVSFSSIRSGTLEERDQWMMLQEWFIEAFFEPVFAEWLRSALSFGQITLANGSALPTAKLEKFSGHVFKGRRWEWVDPLRDVQADIQAIQARLKSPQEVASKMGLDYEDLLVQIKQAEDMQAAAGLQPIQMAPQPGQQAGGAENQPTG